MVSRPLETFGNLFCKNSSSPNSATNSRHSQISSAECIRPDDARWVLKKSQRNHKEFVKKALG